MAADQKPAWTRHLITFLLIFGVIGLLTLSGRSCHQQPGTTRPADARIVPVKIDRWTVRAEVADTQELRRKGLSGRASIDPGYGMLFVFEEPSIVSFWMKDTTIPLSIAFIKEDGTIAQIERMQPQDLTRISSNEPVQYVLEVRQGWFEERGLKPGIGVEIPRDQLSGVTAVPKTSEPPAGPAAGGEPKPEDTQTKSGPRTETAAPEAATEPKEAK
jgi:hypothetical protein